MFGSQSKTTAFGSSSFGTTSGFSSGFGASAIKQPQSGTDASTVRLALEKSGILKAENAKASSLEKMVEYQQQLDSESSKFIFKGVLYNMVHPTQVKNYGPPPNSQPAENSNYVNPEPRCMVPVPVSGLESLSTRNKNQVSQISRQQFLLNKINEKIQTLTDKQKTELLVQTQKVQDVHSQLRNKITELNKELSVLNNKGLPLQPAEENLWKQVNENESKIYSTKQFKMIKKKVDAQLQKAEKFDNSSKIERTKATELLNVLEENSKACLRLKKLLQEELDLAKQVHSFKLQNHSSFL